MEVVKELIQMGAKKDERDETGRTPLHLAAVEGHVDAVAGLVMMGVDVRVKDDNGMLSAPPIFFIPII